MNRDIKIYNVASSIKSGDFCIKTKKANVTLSPKQVIESLCALLDISFRVYQKNDDYFLRKNEEGKMDLCYAEDISHHGSPCYVSRTVRENLSKDELEKYMIVNQIIKKIDRFCTLKEIPSDIFEGLR